MIPTKLHIDVTDTHSVASHPLWPARARIVASPPPSPAPCNLNIPPAVPAPFQLPVPVSTCASTEYIVVPLPTASPVVTITLSDDAMPAPPTMHRMDVSDSHSDTSHPVSPARPIPVESTEPSPDPCTVIDLTGPY